MKEITLTPYEQKYLPDLRKWLSNNRLMERMSIGPFRKEEIEGWLTRPSHDTILIAKNESNDVIGYATFHHFSPDGKTASHGTLIDPDFQGQGYGKAVLAQSVNYGFSNLGLIRIEFGIKDDNIISKHNVESLGYKFDYHDPQKMKSYYYIEK